MAWYDKIKKCGEYDSKFEASIADQLTAARIKWWREPLPVPYRNNTGSHRYIPDFGVKTKDGKRVLIEVKGWIDAAASNKMSAVKYQHPELDIRFVFQRGETKVVKLKSTNLKWARRLNFPAAVGKVPDDWLAEFMTVEEWRTRKKPEQTT